MKFHVRVLGMCLLLLASSAMGLLAPGASWAQAEAAALGSAPEFDWSDYRGTANGRMFLARLKSVNIRGGGVVINQELVGPILSNDMQFFKELIGVLYIDRLGLRVCAEEATVEGRHEPLTNASPANPHRYPQLDIGPTRIGLDLDIIRYPFVKVGFNVDYGFHGVKLKHVRLTDIQDPNSIDKVEYRSDGPITIGLHTQAIPFRLKEVPAIIHARVRAPVPYLEQVAKLVGLKQIAEIAKVKVLDWEVSAGLRPAVWDTSFFGYSTFSLSVEAGYRSFTIDTPLTAFSQEGVNLTPPNNFPTNLDLRANWQGVFFQGTVFY